MKKGEKRKQELLQIAYRLFVTKGYENTSVEEIIEEAGIAKGTYYYHFESKEQMLEEVIGMMIEQEAERAAQIVASDIPAQQKIVGIISSLRPAPEEQMIEGALYAPENTVMHDKILKKLISVASPMLTEVVEEGIREGVFSCDNIPQRVRMVLVISNALFNEEDYTPADIEVFIDAVEKIFGAKEGTMDFIRELIR